MYNITVVESPVIVTVPANMSSVELSRYPYIGAGLVADREYTITVSAISDRGTSYPGYPVIVGEFTDVV